MARPKKVESNNIVTNEVITIDNETQIIVEQDAPKTIDYTMLGNQLFSVVTNVNMQLRDKLLSVLDVAGSTIEGLTAVANAYAENYTNKDIKKARKSELNTIFKAYIANKGIMLESITDKQKNLTTWVKDARTLLNGERTPTKKTSLNESEVDNLQDKAELLNNEQASRVLDTLSSRLNGQLAFMLIGSLIDKLLDDDNTEPVFKNWAMLQQQSHIDVMNQVYKAKKEAAEASQNVANMAAALGEASL